MSDSPISHHEPTKDATPDSEKSADSDSDDAPASVEQQQQMEQAYAKMKRKMTMQEMGAKIKHKIMVLSGKGGVGKSTVATGLSLSLAAQGHQVGLLDIDITGPNVPKMLGLVGHRLHVEEGRIYPAIGHSGVKVISMAFLLEDEDTPVVWRGPIKLGAIQQFLGDVEWGELDYLIIDFPPGTSDEPLTVVQSLPDIDGMVVVTTPQDVALLDSRKSIGFATSLKVPVLGVVENMSGYTIRGTAEPKTEMKIDGPEGSSVDVVADAEGNWSTTMNIFKAGGGQTTAEEMGVPFLGRLPFDPGVVRGGDDGVHRIVADPQGESALAFAKVVAQLDVNISSAKKSGGLEII
jgi:ATP-binding protein involved in chromosome partitioning